MRLFFILMLVSLQFHFLLLLASNSSTLDIPQHSSINKTEALTEDGRVHIAAIIKKGGGGGGGGRGGGGGGRGGGSGRGGSGNGRGATLPFYGAAAGATAAHGSRSHHRGSTCRSARIGLTLPSLLIGLGIFLIQF